MIKFPDSILLKTSFQYYFVPFLYLAGFITITVEAPPIYLLTLIFLVVPLCDEYLEFDLKNPTHEQAREMENQLRFKLPLYISVISDYFMTYQVLLILTSGQLPTFVAATILFANGLLGGSNINIAHELTLVGSFKSAWKIEKQRLKRKRVAVLGLHNRMLRYQFNNLMAVALVWWLFGSWGVLYYLIMALTSILFLETVNYIEHYGLQRKEISPGVYEKVNITHSWNAPHRFTNYLLFKLQRHSDHHENALKPYQILMTQDRSPILPNGYALCTILALFPPIWKNIMEDMLNLQQVPLEQRSSSKFWTSARKKVRLFIAFLGFVCFAGIYFTNRSVQDFYSEKPHLLQALHFS